MNRLLLAVLVLVLLMLFFVFASRLQFRHDSGTVGGPLILQAYSVETAQAKQLQLALSNLFATASSGDSQKRAAIGQATLTPSGALLVLAPESIHEGVKSLVSQKALSASAATPSIRMTYWMVIGSPTEGKKPSEVAEIQNALAVIEKSDGLARFTVQEKSALQAMPDEIGKLVGRAFELEQRLSFDGKTVNGKVSLTTTRGIQQNSAELNVSMLPNQTVVLAMSAVASSEPGDATKQLYFLARPVVDAVAQP